MVLVVTTSWTKVSLPFLFTQCEISCAGVCRVRNGGDLDDGAEAGLVESAMLAVTNLHDKRVDARFEIDLDDSPTVTEVDPRSRRGDDDPRLEACGVDTQVKVPLASGDKTITDRLDLEVLHAELELDELRDGVTAFETDKKGTGGVSRESDSTVCRRAGLICCRSGTGIQAGQ